MLSAAAARPAAAQSAPADVEVGYQYLHASASGSGLSFPAGLNVAVNGRVAGAVSVLGEVSWSRHSDTVAGTDIHLDATSYGGGVRWTDALKPVKPFAQVVIGGEHDGATGGSSENSFMIQPGIGVLAAAGPIDVYAQVDYRRVFSSVAQNDVRVAVGVSIPIGR